MLLLVLCLPLAARAQTYTDKDIQEMKSRYERKPSSRSGSKNFPGSFWKREYREPVLVPWMLPYQDWEQEYRAYFRRHYRDASLTFKPGAIVMHYTVTPDATSVRNGFLRGANMSAGDQGLVRGHVSVQLLIDQDGKVYQLMPLDRRCTGAYGVNHVALSIELVARDENELLSRPQQVYSSFCLVRSLMKQFDIPLGKVYGHHEVSIGRSVVPEYTDYADSVWPHGYPPECARIDPGPTYMRWLRAYIGKVGPAP